MSEVKYEEKRRDNSEHIGKYAPKESSTTRVDNKREIGLPADSVAPPRPKLWRIAQLDCTQCHVAVVLKAQRYKFIFNSLFYS